MKTIQDEAERVVHHLTTRDRIIEAMIRAGIASWHFVVYNCDGSILCRGEGGEQLQVCFGQVHSLAKSLDPCRSLMSLPGSPEVLTHGAYWVAHVSQRGLVSIVAFKPADDVMMDGQIPIPGHRDGRTCADHMFQQAENAAVLLGIDLGHLVTEVRVLAS